MNDYFPKILIRERQHQLSKDAGAVQRESSWYADDRRETGKSETPGSKTFSFKGAIGRRAVVSRGGKA